MRDIVATIQPEQDEIVRADVDETICVQGAPGTGKTAVGLHRAAYLLYAHRERLRRAGVLVVGPNRRSCRYIAAVLPALGEVDVRQATVDELVGARVPVRADEAAAVAALKGDAADGRGAATARCTPRLAEPTEALVRAARRRAGGGCPAYELRRDRRRAARPRRPVRRRPGRCSRSGSRTPCSPRWRRPASRPTTACRTRWPGRTPGAQALVDAALAGGRPGAGRAVGCCPTRDCSPRRPTACSTDDEQALLLWAKPAARPRQPPGGRWPTRCWSTRPPT